MLFTNYCINIFNVFSYMSFALGEGDTFKNLKVPGEEKSDDPTKSSVDKTASSGNTEKKKLKKKKRLYEQITFCYVVFNLLGFLDDRKFLQISKKIGGDWEALANTLGLAEEDVTEIMESEGATYQGAFKMLWNWRDRTLDIDQDNTQVLQEALKACGKEDIASLV